MQDEFGPNFITLTDEDGNDIELEYVDALELDGQTYMAFFPTVEDDADEAVAALGDHPRRVTREAAPASYLRQLVEVVSTPPSTTRSSGVAASP